MVPLRVDDRLESADQARVRNGRVKQQRGVVGKATQMPGPAVDPAHTHLPFLLVAVRVRARQRHDTDGEAGASTRVRQRGHGTLQAASLL